MLLGAASAEVLNRNPFKLQSWIVKAALVDQILNFAVSLVSNLPGFACIFICHR